MNATQSVIPTETLHGCVVKQLFHGQPFLVFVEDSDPQTPGKPRGVALVVETATGYKPATGHRSQYEGLPNTEPAHIAAEYLAQFPPI